MKSSSIITHQEIAHRAHEIWEQTGQPDGYETEHWFQAERELREQLGKQDEEQLEKVNVEAKLIRGTPRKVSKR